VTRRALISVTDKTGVVEFARALTDLGFSLLSTGGTFQALAAGGVRAQEVADYTGFPEAMGGRLKTLHPRVHGGLLARRDDPAHRAAMSAHGIDPIDLLCVNLYAFREAAARPGIAPHEVVEQIDIGGPAMLRSAAKNHDQVAVVVDPQDYGRVLAALREQGGRLPAALARELAAKAFAHTAAYDAAIAGWFEAERRRADGAAALPPALAVTMRKLQDLRYGENPHQHAAFYAVDAPGPTLASAKQQSGKELSYNNLLDLDSALALALEFEPPCCVIVKHNNPCGTAIAPKLEQAFLAALQSDPTSAFGGILAVNRPLTAAAARTIVEHGTFVEAILAPEIQPEARDEIAKARWGQNVRLLALGGWPVATPARVLRQVSGGFLVQTPDAPRTGLASLQVATKRPPSPAEQGALLFAWLVAKHVRSNAIVLARETQKDVFATVGVGAGQMSRVDSVRIAVMKAGERARGSVVASDAFFPFADGIEAAAAAGVTAAIQPGGSKRDAEVVAAADAAGLAMVWTGVRHFRH
jgi:phosphoribosylaminoimidazolecarboxamide formyltransferase/IMP cyclohydrolase